MDEKNLNGPDNQEPSEKDFEALKGKETTADPSLDEALNRSRFPSPHTPRDPSGFPQTGIIEVEFRREVLPKVPKPGTLPRGQVPTLSSQTETDLTGFNQLLENYRVDRAEASFDLTKSPRGGKTVDDEGNELPDRRNFVTLYFPEGEDIRKIAEELNQLPEVEWAVPIPGFAPPFISPKLEPLVGISDQVIPNPFFNTNQWYIHRTKVYKAWDHASGAGVVVADIDWGYRLSHNEFAGRVAGTFNAYDGGTDVTTGPAENVLHGTAVLGLAGAAINLFGMSGVAYGATLWAVQGNTGPGPFLGGDPWARAIDWVRMADSGGRRKVIILEVQTGAPEFGNIEMVPSVNAAIRLAIAWGVVVCVAAGNGDRDASRDSFNNLIPETGSILVGATEYHPTENRRATFSNYGSRITVTAPGDVNYDVTCDVGSDYAFRDGFGGTSGATPKVAGTVALMLEIKPTLTHAQIRHILATTGSPIVTAPGKPVGTFLNAEAAVIAARSY